MTILVTGASGFIGTHFTSYLTSHGLDFYPLSSSDLDLTNENLVKDFLHNNNFSAVIHLASVGLRHSQALSSQVNDLNVVMAENLLKFIHPDLPILFAGSMSEYGFPGIHKESDHCQPRTEYGKSKLRITNLSIAYSHERNLNSKIARIYGVYGQNEHPERLFPSLITSFLTRSPIALSDCMQYRDFVYVKDLAPILLALISPDHQTYDNIINVGTGHPICVKDIVVSLAQEFGASSDCLRFGSRSRSPGDEDLLCADVSLLSSIDPSLVPPQRLVSSQPLSSLFL